MNKEAEHVFLLSKGVVATVDLDLSTTASDKHVEYKYFLCIDRWKSLTIDRNVWSIKMFNWSMN